MKMLKKVLEEVVRDTVIYRVRDTSKTQLRYGHMVGKFNKEEYKTFDKFIEVTELPDYFLSARNNPDIVDSLVKVPCKETEDFLKPSNLKKADQKYNLKGMIFFDNVHHFPHKEDEISLLERELDQDSQEYDRDFHIRTIDPELAKELGKLSKIIGKPFNWCLMTLAPDKESLHYPSNPYCVKHTEPCGHSFYHIPIDNSDFKRIESEIINMSVSNIMDTIELHNYNSKGELVNLEVVD